MKTVALRAAGVTAAVYGYFLLFAQFSFVELMRAGFSPGFFSSRDVAEKSALGVMALAGVGMGFFVAWKGVSIGRVRVALLLAAVAAGVAPYASSQPAALVVAIVTGAALGVSTVSLAALVPGWCGVAWLGLGTGLGYAWCNVPFVFASTPAHQAWISAALAAFGAICLPPQGTVEAEEKPRPFPFWGVLILFTALVWLDSAAFFVIQHVEELKNGTWGDSLLWRNSAAHLLAAVLAGLWLKKGPPRLLPGIAWVMLAIAVLVVGQVDARPVAGWLYPAAVSLYSTALVAWPGFFSGVHDQRRITWRAAWLYAIAGWFGSANGIGMAQSLQRVPVEFILVSGAAVILVMLLSDLKRWRILLAVAAVMVVYFLTPGKELPPGETAIERGRQVYLSEGCIHCHSQYVRPGSADEERWGPVHEARDTLSAHPVLIGNRRQGPDLSNIGARRSTAWLKLHFIDPRAVSPASTMPSYESLFDTGKGEDLIAYLKHLGEDQTLSLQEKIATWRPSTEAASADGKALFASQCAACHGPEGHGDGPQGWGLAKSPANLRNGPFLWTPESDDHRLKVAQIVKFGIPGTDMPGHETLQDGQILALTDYILSLRKTD